VERIRRHDILVVGSFIMGLDSDRPGVGGLIAGAATRYGVDNMNVLFLTPLPGTRLWKHMTAEGRLGMDSFPDDWKYYTLNHPVAKYKHLTRDQIIEEMRECNETFYSAANILSRLTRSLLTGSNPFITLVSNLTSRRNSKTHARLHAALWQSGVDTHEIELPLAAGWDLIDMWEDWTEQARRWAAAFALRLAWWFRQS
jgi:radical SAM superfamily enzyme YgiQ (UPF0313 family)